MTSNRNSEFAIPKGDIRPSIRQRLRLAGAVNVTGAAVTFRYKPEGQSSPITSRMASIIGTPTGGISAATELDVQYDWISADVATVGRYEFEWLFTLQDGTTVHVPVKAPLNSYQDRIWQVFEVVDVI